MIKVEPEGWKDSISRHNVQKKSVDVRTMHQDGKATRKFSETELMTSCIEGFLWNGSTIIVKQNEEPSSYQIIGGNLRILSLQLLLRVLCTDSTEIKMDDESKLKAKAVLCDFFNVSTLEGNLLMDVYVLPYETPKPLVTHFRKLSNSFSIGRVKKPERSKLSKSSTSSKFVRKKQTDDNVNQVLYANDNFRRNNIDSSKLIILDVIGSGSYGEVVRGEYSSSSVAIKRMHSYMPSEEADNFINEIRLLMSLRHPNVVQFIGTSFIDGYGLCAITEFMERGDLTTVLSNISMNSEFSWGNLKMSIATDIILSLAYLHGLEPVVMHRDLKSRNVLISQNFTAKISDFGLSRAISTTSTMTCVGSNLWLAPEMIRGEQFSESADIFSFGVMMTELDTGKMPYHDLLGYDGKRMSSIAIAHQVAYKNRRPTMSEDCYSKLDMLANWCMHSDPLKRPSPKSVLKTLRQVTTDSNISF